MSTTSYVENTDAKTVWNAVACALVCAQSYFDINTSSFLPSIRSTAYLWSKRILVLNAKFFAALLDALKITLNNRVSATVYADH